MKVYFDNAATTPLDKEVLNEMLPFMTEHFGNPSSIHSFGRKTRAAIEEARKKVAKLLCVSPSEIFFTSGGTEADNMAILGATTFYQSKGKHLVTMATEHKAVLDSFHQLEKEGFIPKGAEIEKSFTYEESRLIFLKDDKNHKNYILLLQT